jgi:hypothetical protein
MERPATLAMGGLGLAAILLASLAQPALADAPGGVIVGQARAPWFRILGTTGGGLVGGPAYEDSLFCAPCSVEIRVTDSQLVQVGTGSVGPLPAGFTYQFAAFYGVVNIQEIGLANYVLELQGSAEHVYTE